LPPEIDTYRIQGFVNTSTDIDIYQFTIDTDRAIQFSFDKLVQRCRVLIYGVDNPHMNTFDLTKFPYFLPAGTYNLTFPAGEKIIYNFELSIGTEVHETEVVNHESVEISADLTTYRYSMSFDYFNDTEKIDMHVDNPVKLSLEFPTGIRVNGVFTNDSNGNVSYFSYSNTIPETYISIPGPGELFITFETTVSSATNELILGDFEVKMNLFLVD